MIVTQHLLENLSQGRATPGTTPMTLKALSGGGVALLVQRRDEYSTKKPYEMKKLIAEEKERAKNKKIKVRI